MAKSKKKKPKPEYVSKDSFGNSLQIGDLVKIQGKKIKKVNP